SCRPPFGRRSFFNRKGLTVPYRSCNELNIKRSPSPNHQPPIVMHIALVSTLSAPVGRDAPGSVEAWTWLLTRELRRLGHEITIFGCAGSEAEGEVVVTLPGPYGAPGSYDDWQLCEWVNLCRAVEQSDRFDVLHSQAYLWGIPLENLSRA